MALPLFVFCSHPPHPKFPCSLPIPDPTPFPVDHPYLGAVDKSPSPDSPTTTEMNINHLKWEETMKSVF